MVRAAAKNHTHVGIVVDPADYGEVLAELRAQGRVVTSEHANAFHTPAFAHTASYDAAIVEWFDEADGSEATSFPPSLHPTLELAAQLRYGENAHQSGARYRLRGSPTWWDGVVQHGGTQLSYLNLFDTDAAWRLVFELPQGEEAAAVIVKHANPCGAAVAGSLADAYRRALECDPVSAFGGVVALGGHCTEEVAGPRSPRARRPTSSWARSSGPTQRIAALVARRKATRLLEAHVTPRPTTTLPWSSGASAVGSSSRSPTGSAPAVHSGGS